MNRLEHTYPLTPYEYVFEIPEFPLAIKPQSSPEDLDMHTHERFHEIVLVIAGRAKHYCGKSCSILNARDIFVVPPGMAHGYSQCENIDYYNILVDFRQLRLPLYDLVNTSGYQNLFVLAPRSHVLGEKKPLHNDLNFKDLDYCVGLLNRMLKFQTLKVPGYQMGMLALFMDFLRVICHVEEADREETPHSLQNVPYVIGNIATTLARHCSDDWPVRRICQCFNLSRPVLFREFLKYYHMSPVKFLNQRRLRKAMSLLINSDLSLEQIAVQCGFANGSYFSTAFTRQFGITPLKFRRNPKIPALPLTDGIR